MKKLKIKIKGWLLVKLAKARSEAKAYKDKLAEEVLKEKDYIDKMSLMQDDIRQLLLKLEESDRADWLRKKGKDYEGYFSKKKSIKRKIKSIANYKI